MKKVILYTQDRESVEPISTCCAEKEKKQDAISRAAVDIAEKLNATAIIVETKTGSTAVNIAKHKPNLPIISVSSEVRTAQQLSLSYANRSYVRPISNEIGYDMAKELKNQGYFDENPITVVIVSGRQSGVAGKTDTIEVRLI